MLAATIGVAIIYIVSTNIIAGIVPNAELVKSNAPFGLTFTMMFNSTIGKIVTFLLVLSCAGSTLGWQFTIAKVFQQSAIDGFFPKCFAKVNKWKAPVLGMIIITAIQTGFCFMTISPELFKQFNRLVDLAVVTNIMPYLLSMAAVAVIMKIAKWSPQGQTLQRHCNHRRHLQLLRTLLYRNHRSFLRLFSHIPRMDALGTDCT